MCLTLWLFVYVADILFSGCLYSRPVNVNNPSPLIFGIPSLLCIFFSFLVSRTGISYSLVYTPLGLEIAWALCRLQEARILVQISGEKFHLLRTRTASRLLPSLVKVSHFIGYLIDRKVWEGWDGGGGDCDSISCLLWILIIVVLFNFQSYIKLRPGWLAWGCCSHRSMASQNQRWIHTPTSSVFSVKDCILTTNPSVLVMCTSTWTNYSM